MKTIKLKACNSITLANPYAPLGRTPSGAVIFEVTNIPDEVPTFKIVQKYSGCVSAYMGTKLSHDYAA